MGGCGSHGVAEVLGSLVAPGSQWGGLDPEVPVAVGAQGVAQVLGTPVTLSPWGVAESWDPLWLWGLEGVAQALCPQCVPAGSGSVPAALAVR